jgi:hypothetical protein
LKSKPKSLAFASLGLVGILAGCSGAATNPQTASGVSAPQALSAETPIDLAKCKVDHGVSVKPCSVKLTVTNPTEQVTTKGPSGGTFTDKDKKCSSKDIATITGTGNTFTVTAGLKSGKCNGKFIDKDAKGKRIGTAILSITNTV